MAKTFKFLKNKGEWQEPGGIQDKYKKERNLWIDFKAFRPVEELSGYEFLSDMKDIRFVFQPAVYDAAIHPTGAVYVVGTFNDWATSIGDPGWRMKKDSRRNRYMFETNTAAIRVEGPSGHPEFKFVTGAEKWHEVDDIDDQYKKNNNLWVNFDIYGDITPPRPIRATLEGKTRIIVRFNEPVEKLSANNTSSYSLVGSSIRSAELRPGGTEVQLLVSPIDIEAKGYRVDGSLIVGGISDTSGVRMVEEVRLPVTLSRSLLKRFFDGIPATTQELGCTFAGDRVSFRLFGPRLQAASLLLYAGHHETNPVKEVVMKRDADYVWTATVASNDAPHGTFYKFSIKRGAGASIINDAYARANVHSAGKSIVIRPNVNDPPFTGWTDQKYVTPPLDELLIYETHLANITGRNPAVSNMAHTYLALAVDAPGSPLRHLRELGVNAIELMPLHEFQNGSSLDFRKHYHWGYMNSLFFAPESSFSTDPAARRQVSELKQLVDTLHSHGIAVIVDVVFNHVSNIDNCLGETDFEYYFTGRNDSGCGNTTYCSRPMMRKLILDSLCQWVSEYHIDGYRFDLSQLMDQKNLFTAKNIRKVEEAKATRGNLILIAENWSSDRADLKGTGVAQWNDWMREDIKEYVSKGERKDSIPKRVRWSNDRNAYAGPMETVNYFESHDENSVAHRIRSAGWTNRDDQLKRARMAALILLTSQGIPMLCEGQEMLRDRPAQLQDYDSNMVDWNLARKNAGLVEFYRRLIALRKKHPSLRSPKDEGTDFYRFLRPNHPSAVGYVLNADFTYKNEPRFAVLLNPGKTAADFTLPKGAWEVLANEDGFLSGDAASASGSVRLPGGASRLLRQAVAE